MKNSKDLNIDFLLVGVARCGTTSLFHYLKQHPDINFPKIKEPKYFSSKVINFPQNGIGDITVDVKMIKDFISYKKLFEGFNTGIVGEASSDYFYYHKLVIPLIKEALGDIPILISIRNPYDRAFSAYNNLLRDGRENLSFLESLIREEERIQQGWDWMWHYKNGSLYSEGIKNFILNFSKVKVVLYDDLDSPNSVLNDILDFLGVEHFLDFDTTIKYSPSGQPKNLFVKLISSRNIRFINFFRKKFIELVPRRYLELISKGFYKKDKYPKEVVSILSPFFNADIDETQKLIDRDLSNWKK